MNKMISPKDWWRNNLEKLKREAKLIDKCYHKAKVVGANHVDCMVCGEVLADNNKDARQYFA